MSSREELKGEIFSDVLVLKFSTKEEPSFTWKCLCMLCNKVIYVSSSNLMTKNTKSCSSCGQKKTSYRTDCMVIDMINRGSTQTATSEYFNISRGIVRQIKKEKSRWNCTLKSCVGYCNTCVNSVAAIREKKENVMSTEDLQAIQTKTDLEIKKLMQETTWGMFLKFYSAILATVAITVLVTRYFIGT